MFPAVLGQLTVCFRDFQKGCFGFRVAGPRGLGLRSLGRRHKILIHPRDQHERNNTSCLCLFRSVEVNIGEIKKTHDIWDESAIFPRRGRSPAMMRLQKNSQRAAATRKLAYKFGDLNPPI